MEPILVKLVQHLLSARGQLLDLKLQHQESEWLFIDQEEAQVEAESRKQTQPKNQSIRKASQKPSSKLQQRSLSCEKILHLSQIMVKEYMANKNSPSVMKQMMEPSCEQIISAVDFLIEEVSGEAFESFRTEKIKMQKAFEMAGKVKEFLRPLHHYTREEKEDGEEFEMCEIGDERQRKKKSKSKKRVNAIQVTMDELEVYHLTYKTDRFIPPQGQYCPFRITHVQDTKQPLSFTSPATGSVFGNSQLFLKAQSFPKSQWQTIKQSLQFLQLIYRAKNGFSDYKNIIISDGTLRDAYHLVNNKQHYLKKMDLIRICAQVYIERGYSYAKVKEIYARFCQQVRYFKSYQKMMYSMNRLVIRIVQTYIIKNFEPGLKGIHHRPGLMNLEGKMHYMQKHFEPSVVDTYYKIIRIMFEIGDVEDNQLTKQKILRFYRDVKEMSLEMEGKKVYKLARDTSAMNVSKPMDVQKHDVRSKIALHNREALRMMRVRDAERRGVEYREDQQLEGVKGQL